MHQSTVVTRAKSHTSPGDHISQVIFSIFSNFFIFTEKNSFFYANENEIRLYTTVSKKKATICFSTLKIIIVLDKACF